MLEYRGERLPEDPTAQQAQQAVADCEAILCTSMETILERFEAHPEYPFVDTKLDLRTGRDHPADDPLRGRSTIFGWMQGRGLEAVAGHARWMQGHGRPEVRALAPRLTAMAAQVLDTVRRIRDRNQGHLYFFMRPDGSPFALGPDGGQCDLPRAERSAHNFSDLFAAKGMLAAAHLLGNAGATQEALAYCRDVDEDILSGGFTTDQQPLDPKNPVRPVPGRFTHGHFMLQLASAALRLECGDGDALDLGLRLLRHELSRHANLQGCIPELREGDFWEAVDEAGQPYRESTGAILSDPGHALEFVGLGLKFIGAARACGPSAEVRAELDQAARHMPLILQRGFANGFLPGPEGICKSYDLVSRSPANDDLPWWSLPETMRAALLAAEVSDAPEVPDEEETRRECLRIFAASHNAFVTHYVLPDVHLMAVQMRAADGSVSTAIPGTTDADPGYHTGLSLIDGVEALKRIH